MKILKLGPTIFLFCAGIASCLKHHGGSNFPLHHNLTDEDISYFEKLKNLTDGEKEKLKPLKICGSLFVNEAIPGQYFTTCLAEIKSNAKVDSDSEEDDKPHRNKRDALMSDTKIDHGFNTDDELTNPAQEDNTIDDYNDVNTKLKPRRRRQVGKSFPVHPRRGPWHIFDSPHIRRNPCLVSCILAKQGLINSTGELDIDGVLESVENLLVTANTTEPKMMASRIVNMCIAQQYEIVKTKELSNEDDIARLKCRSIVQISKCLSRDVFVACRNGFGTANLISTSTGKST